MLTSRFCREGARPGRGCSHTVSSGVSWRAAQRPRQKPLNLGISRNRSVHIQELSGGRVPRVDLFLQALPAEIETPLDFDWEILQQVEDPWMERAIHAASWLTQDAYPRLDLGAIGNASRAEFEWAHKVCLSIRPVVLQQCSWHGPIAGKFLAGVWAHCSRRSKHAKHMHNPG